MAGSDENNSRGVIGLSNLRGSLLGGGSKVMSEIGQNRRALSSIDHNIIRSHPYPSSAHQKRGLTEEKNVFNKDGLPIPAHRPITRKFAAQMANKKQLAPAVTQIPAQLEKPSKESDDCTIVDAEDIDFPVPMFVQHTEAMLEEIDRMEEVEMKDINEDPVEDIDSCDKNNSLAVVEYLEDLFSHYRKAEISNCVSPDYMAHQSDINERMRGILVDWLIEVHYKFELMDETLYLTVNLIDRFLSLQPVVRKKLQLVGVTAMLLACKYEEVSVPIVDDLILISDKAYCRKEVLEMEKLMVNALQFHMSVPTPYVFMKRFLKASQSHHKLELLSFFMVELCLVEYETLKFHPSLLAAAAIFTAQCALNGFQQWSKTSEWYTGYSEEQLLECSMKMVAFHQKAGTGKLTGVHRKYSTAKFGYAARIEPAEFLLEERF